MGVEKARSRLISPIRTSNIVYFAALESLCKSFFIFSDTGFTQIYTVYLKCFNKINKKSVLIREIRV